MKIKAPSTVLRKGNASLELALKSNKLIKQRVTKAASDLAQVNQLLEQDGTPDQVSELALHQNKNVEQKVTKAAKDLNRVNAKLANEISQRTLIESELDEVKSELAEARVDLSNAQLQVDMAQQLAMHDPLTGLPNRAAFERALKHGLIQAKRHNWGLAVLFIDIDKFKGINDAFGHHMGDQVLLTVAKRLTASVRGEDMVSRWGGDEFVCLLLNVKQASDVCFVAEQLVGRIAETCELHKAVFSIKASIGIAIYPADGETAEMLFKNADSAMYGAKGTESRVVQFRQPCMLQPPQEQA
ncbi:MAG: GGDEF domain-containing protein [Gammaproteobacteria bacterium HGW-Gammaproteobacteria-11]|nr:MAG: GGDEF domain-containing protein [Gammaproteobacteria bacterium HGW-Gammaproteobacteria-11]